MADVTLDQIVRDIRDLTLDHYQQPTLFVGVRNKSSANTTETFTFNKDSNLLGVNSISPKIDLTLYEKASELNNAMANYFSGRDDILSEVWTSTPPDTEITELNNVVDKVISDDPESVDNWYVIVYRDHFFNRAKILSFVTNYFWYYKQRYYTTEEELLLQVSTLDPAFIPHLIIWCSFYALEDRRKFEMMASAIPSILYGGSGSGAMSSGQSYSFHNLRTEVNIGSVFSLSYGGPESSSIYGSGKGVSSPTQVGSDNVIGDINGVWYLLQGQIRKRMEDLYACFDLRSEQVISGASSLDRVHDFNLMSYFDSFPYTISPYLRSILSNRSITGSGASAWNAGVV